jgi:hypothetical protein
MTRVPPIPEDQASPEVSAADTFIGAGEGRA